MGVTPAGLVAELAALRPRPGSMVRYHTLLALRELGRRAQFLDAQVFPTGWLKTREAAYQWLAAATPAGPAAV